jgi:hypothetical protein
MAVKLVFHGTEESRTNLIALECYVNNSNKIVVILVDTDCEHDYDQQSIVLDKETAVRLSRELRKQIALLD